MIAVIVVFKEEIEDYLSVRDFILDGRTEDARFYRSPDQRDVVVVQCGMGRRRSEEATRQVIQRFGPELVVSAGFAGGVVPGLVTGDLFVCQKLWVTEGPFAEWSVDLAESFSILSHKRFERYFAGFNNNVPKYVRGDCLSVPKMGFNSSKKRLIGELFPVSVIDMESFWISKMADQYNVPTMVVKSLLDPLEQTLPSFVDDLSSMDGYKSWKRVLGHAITRPSEMPRVLHLFVQMRVARASLAAFLNRLA